MYPIGDSMSRKPHPHKPHPQRKGIIDQGK
jgi:hypothetical protein